MAGLLGRLFGRSAAPETRASAFYGPAFAIGSYPGPVLPYQAENLATVTACVNAIAGTLATLPARVYRPSGPDGQGRVEVPGHPVSRLIRSPNPHQTWPDWLEWTVAQALLWGNALSVIESDGAGRVTALIPVPWQNVRVSLLPGGRMAYDVVSYQAPLWAGTGTPRRFLDGEVFCVRDRSDDGFVERSRLSRAPEVLNGAIGLQDYTSTIWDNAISPSGILTMPPKITPEGVRRMAASIQERAAGVRNAKRVLLLNSESKWTPTSVSPEDAEVLESRRFSVEELCRLFNVPPPIVQSYENNTFTNSAQASTWFATNTLTPWARKIEAEFSRSVFVAGDTADLEIDLSGLTRGDFSTRWQANVAAVTAGILTADEVRAAEGYSPLPAKTEPPAAPPANDPVFGASGS